MNRRRSGLALVLVFVLAAFAFGCGRPAQPTDTFPTKPITIIAGYSAGSNTDLVTRIIAESMSKKLGQPVLVENVEGAAGTIALAEVANNRAADGYTLVTGAGSALAVMPINVELPYKTDDLTYVAKMLDFASVICVRASAPFDTYDGLVAYARQNPGKLIYATEEVLSLNAIQFKMIAEQAGGFEYTIMSTDGSAESLRAVLAGDADVLNTSLPSLLPHINEGTLRPIMVSVPHDLPGLAPGLPKAPDVYGVNMYSVGGIMAPPGLPENVRKILSDAIRYAVEEDQVAVEKFRNMGAAVSWMDGPDFKDLIISIRTRIATEMGY